MVQQQVAAAFNGASPQAGPTANGTISVEATSLAMPAIISSNNSTTTVNNSNHSPQSQYSPQASLYQQQLIKSAQQFVAHHHHQQQQQQQQQQQPSLNGLNGTSNIVQQPYSAGNGNQQNSPQTNHQFANTHLQQTESLYNNSRLAPAVYAPKPTYYGQITQQQNNNNSQVYQQQQQQAAVGGRQVSQLQTRYYATQHSPIGASQTMTHIQQPMALSVRQAPTAVFQGQTVSSLSPSQHQQQIIEQQHRQMQQQQQQQLVMSYQDQQQQQIQQLQATYPIQQQHQPLMAAPLGRHQLLNVGQQGGAWPASQQDLEQQQQQQQQQLKGPHLALAQQPMFHPAVARQLTGGVMASGRPALGRAGAFSDRDSVSTLSRFNQFDDRRSFTMRSQFTAQPIGGAGKRNSQFGFLELTGEATKRLLGLSGNRATSQRQPLLLGSADQLQQNLSLAAANEHHKQQPGMPGASQQQQQQQVTVIDSGEDQQFKRQVFRYQLGIVRLVHLLMSALVLLSPLAMLLIPKMEPLIRSLESTGVTSPGSSLEYNSQEPPVAPTSSNVVTHAVGLLGQKHLATKHHQQQQQQNQMPWHIGECQSSECDGPLIGFVIRLIMLAIAHWAIFFRRQTVTLPRVDFQRCFLISLALLVTCAYWLFFMFRVFDKRHNLELELPYMTIVQFAISMLETLILLHYLALVLVELRHRKKVFCLKVVRSPDGESKYYSAGILSVQKCAQFVLEKYHRDFSQFDSYREQLLAFEDQLAHHLKRQRQNQQAGADSTGEGQEQQAGETRHRRSRHQRSRANSPQSDDEPPVDSNEEEDDDDNDNKGGEEATGEERGQKRGARHHHRAHHHHNSRRHRSSSRHARDRERDEDDEQRRSPMRSARSGSRQKRNEREVDAAESSEQQESGAKRADENQKQAKSANESGDHESSDNTSRMKESSLETVRGAGGNSDQAAASSQATTATKIDLEISERPKQQVGGRSSSRRPEELESVRSARSRRSTGSRMHQHHHRSSRSTRGDHHSSSRRSDRERSPSRTRSHHTTIELENVQDQVAGSSTPVDQMDEHERKLRRRKLRLLAAVEDSFEQIKLLDEAGPLKQHQNSAELDGGVPVAPTRPVGLDAGQTARNLYPNIARALQKYLRLTQQTGRHNLASIYEHLSKCLLYKLGARAFLEKFTNMDPVWQQNETNLFANCRLPADPTSRQQHMRKHQDLEINSWSLICDNFLSRQIDSGTFFVLRQGQVSLLVTVAKLPHLSLSEQVIDQSQCRFTMKPAGKPETSSV